MWMARLYPTYERNTCLISNGLSTMAFALPGALGVKLVRLEAKMLAAAGDGAFLMNSQEIETGYGSGSRWSFSSGRTAGTGSSSGRWTSNWASITT